MKQLCATLILCSLTLGCAPKSNPHRFEEADKKIGAKGDQKGELTPELMNWITKDADLDKIAGTSADRAYSLSFVNPNAAPIVVAILDSGVDIEHKDLKDSLWTNLSELNGHPGIDDDGNGYIDDVHGWNFLGGYDVNHNPTFIIHERLEVTRESARMKALKLKRESMGQQLSTGEQLYYDKVTTIVLDNYNENSDNLSENQKQKSELSKLVSQINSLASRDFESLALKDLQNATTLSISEETAKSDILKIFSDNNLRSIAHLNRRIDYYSGQIQYYFNESYDPRSSIIGDDLSDFKNIGYGNNIVWGPKNSDGVAEEAAHGTHVAGIIGAKRGDGVGVDGIANDVRFMTLRAVPDGDETDKDITNAIYYAVNNGARIVNMSFGKGFSPHKNKVDAAFEYASSKGVLLVHAAGNEASDNDTGENFPNRYINNDRTGSSGTISSWLEIGASSAHISDELVADFSNFGKLTVDLFAPGVDVLSTVPGNAYDSYSGTSMASPSTAGVAALVWSQFPSLNVEELKALLVDSVVSYKTLEVKSPLTGDPIAFGELSITGGVVNAYQAMKAACIYTGGIYCQ